MPLSTLLGMVVVLVIQCRVGILGLPSSHASRHAGQPCGWFTAYPVKPAPAPTATQRACCPTMLAVLWPTMDKDPAGTIQQLDEEKITPSPHPPHVDSLVLTEVWSEY